MTNVTETVLITGASSGIGKDLAGLFAASGSKLILVARSTDKLEALAADLGKAHGTHADVIACDLASPDGPAALREAVAARGLAVDVLVNNAGYGLAGGLAQADIDKQLDMLRLNVNALTELTCVYFPQMIKQGRGGVLNISSMAGFMPTPFLSVYAASKAYVLSFTSGLWEEAKGTGVHVTCLAPGSTESGFHDRAGTGVLPAGKTPMMTSMPVAQAGYDGLRANERVVVPGKLNRVTRRIMGVLPESAVLKIMRKSFEG